MSSFDSRCSDYSLPELSDYASAALKDFMNEMNLNNQNEAILYHEDHSAEGQDSVKNLHNSGKINASNDISLKFRLTLFFQTSRKLSFVPVIETPLYGGERLKGHLL